MGAPCRTTPNHGVGRATIIRFYDRHRWKPWQPGGNEFSHRLTDTAQLREPRSPGARCVRHCPTLSDTVRGQCPRTLAPRPSPADPYKSLSCRASATWHAACLTLSWRHGSTSCSFDLGWFAISARANDLRLLYELAESQDATLQAARFQRDAAVEARLQAQRSVAAPRSQPRASATRETRRFQLLNQIGTARSEQLRTYCSRRHRILPRDSTRPRHHSFPNDPGAFRRFSQLKEANFTAAAAEATYQDAKQNLVLRVAKAYFAAAAILSAADPARHQPQRARSFCHAPEPGEGPRTDRGWSPQ